MNGPFGLVGIHAQRHVGMERKAGPGPSKSLLNMEETVVRKIKKKSRSVQLSHVVSPFHKRAWMYVIDDLNFSNSL